MSSITQKVRIILLDEDTGKEISEVDALTSADVILYTNQNPIPKDIGNLKAGTTFEKTSISDILDNILYQYSPVEIKNVETDNPSLPKSFNKDENISIENGTIVPSFKYSLLFRAGSESVVTCSINVHYINKNTYKAVTQFETSIGNSYKAEFIVPEITTDSIVEVSVYDGVNTVKAPSIKYTYINPIFVGFADPKILNNGELVYSDVDLIYDYFMNLISTNNPQLEKRLVEIKTNQEALVMNVDYVNKAKLNPVILIPESWSKVSSISDMHGNNITNSFTFISGINLKLYGNETTPYIIYMCRQTFSVDSKIVGGIRYNFDTLSVDTSELGTKVGILDGFDVYSDSPIDSRFKVATYGDLLKITNAYKGLLTYVEDIDTIFKYNGTWLPTSTRLFLVEKDDDLTEEFAGWDDVAIVLSNSNVYRKRYNNVWELWGTIQSKCDCSEKKIKQWVFHESYDPEFTYVNNDEIMDVVYYKGSSYCCKVLESKGNEPMAGNIWAYLCKGTTSEEVDSDLKFMDIETGEIFNKEDIVIKDLNSGKVVPMSQITLLENKEV